MNFKLKVLGVALFTLGLTSCDTATKEVVTLEDYQNATKHLGANLNKHIYNTVSGSSWNSSELLTYQKQVKEGTQFMKVDIATKEKSLAFDHQKLADKLNALLEKEYTANSLPMRSFSFNENATAIEFTIGRKNYSCDLNSYEITETGNAANRWARSESISPNGKLAAYIDNYNLWVKEVATGKKKQVTFDGFEDFGYATNNAGWIKSNTPVLKWSPDSKKIATMQQDARGVGEMYLMTTNVGHPKLEAWKYALPGDKVIFQIERVIVHVEGTPKTVRLKTDRDYQRSTTTDHIADWGGTFLDLNWSDDSEDIYFISSSRDHKIADLKVANSATGNVASIYTEEVATYFESGVDAENWYAFPDSNEFLWFSERDNWGHLYLYDLTTGKLKNQITKGEWAVQQVLKIDEEKRQIIFTAGGKEAGNPYHKYVYRVDFDGNNLVNLTPDTGDHRVSFNADWTYFVDTYSTTENPPVSVVRNANGEVVVALETTDISELKANGWQQPIEFTVKARDNKTDLYGIMYLPSHYDESKKYPVLNYIYPGPQAGSVGSYAWRATRRDNQALAELGFVVVAVDAMGTPKRSKSFHDAYYGNMGDNGLPDNITAIKQLAERYKGMDIERVGIWGHSGGGFASTAALLRYPEFYDVAVSGAGNHDNRNYEADWGEKWHGLLETNKLESEGDGTTNYDSQANQLLVDNLQGKLLITHGTMDNNVPPSNTMLVVEALIKANKDFDMILFPNKRHGYGDMTNYMTRRKWDYFVKHLIGATPPENFSFN